MREYELQNLKARLKLINDYYITLPDANYSEDKKMFPDVGNFDYNAIEGNTIKYSDKND